MEPGEIGAHQPIFGRQSHGPRQGLPRLAIPPERPQCLPFETGTNSSRTGIGIARGSLGKRIGMAALQQRGGSKQMPDRPLLRSQRQRLFQFLLRALAVAEHQQGTRLQYPRPGQLRIGLDRVHQLDPRRAGIALVERLLPPLHRGHGVGPPVRPHSRGGQSEQRQPTRQQREGSPSGAARPKSGCHDFSADRKGSAG